MVTPPVGPKVPLPGIPAGLVAHAVLPARARGGARRPVAARATGLPYFSRALLVPALPPAGPAPVLPPGLTTAGDQAFVLGHTRREWPAVQHRYGSGAWPTAIALVRAGAVVLLCEVAGDSMMLGAPVRWYRTEAAAEVAEGLAATRRKERERLRAVCQAALDALCRWQRAQDGALSQPEGLREHDLETLAAALRCEVQRAAPAPKRSRILAAVAQDVCAGVLHPNARAFSQAHTGRTKVWDDARAILAVSGVAPAAAAAIGLYRDSRIGVGGAITLRTAGGSVDLALLRGPVLLRAEQDGMELALAGCRLVVVENLQAAESLCDALPLRSLGREVAVAYCAGMPSQAVLELIAHLAQPAQQIVLAPDADLGGVRIAAAVHQALPSPARARCVVCDVGSVAHERQPQWGPGSPVRRALSALCTGPVAALARSCMERGYPVEQEAAIVHAALRLLTGEGPSPE